MLRLSVWSVSRRLVAVSPLGEYIAPLQQHLLLFGVRQLARAAGRSARWTPQGGRPGRSIQASLRARELIDLYQSCLILSFCSLLQAGSSAMGFA